MPEFRGSIGIGFASDNAAETFVHETTHAQGIKHSPCTPPGLPIADVDPKYPYKNGGIGVVGYDIMTGDVKFPSLYKDFMGYCAPTWVSDFQFGKLAKRMQSVATQGKVIPPSIAAKWRVVAVDAAGKPLPGVQVASIGVQSAPSGEPRTVTIDGVTKSGWFQPYGDVPGGVVIVQE